MRRPPKRYTLQQLFQMFAIFGVDLGRRWGKVKTVEEAKVLWSTAKAEAKTRYRAMALELHPDRNPEPKAAEQMAEINQLWGILDGLTPTFSERAPAPTIAEQQEMRRREVANILRGVTVVRVTVEQSAFTGAGTTTRSSTFVGAGTTPTGGGGWPWA